MQRLRRLSPWIDLSPWMVVVCAVLLSVFVVYTGYDNARREREYMSRLMEGKGAALIGTLEAVLRTGMGYQWTDDELQDVLDKTGHQPDVRHMFIVSAEGAILAASNPELVGDAFMTPEELAGFKPSDHVGSVLREDIFWVYRELSVPRFDERLRKSRHGRGMGMGMGMGRGMGMRGMGMGRGMMEGKGHHGDDQTQHTAPSELAPSSSAPSETVPLPSAPSASVTQPILSVQSGQPLIAMVAFDATPVLAAMQADMGHTRIIAAVVVFLGLVGVLTWFLLQAYRTSRRLVLETTAFSSKVIRTLPVGIIATDAAGRVTSLNPEARRILEQEPGQGNESTKVTGNLQSIAHVLPEVWPAFSTAMAEDRAVREQEVRCRVGGRLVPVEFSVAPIATEESELLGYALIVRDLGEIRRLQDELRHSERLAALGNMAAGIAHEIRNPLGAIKGLARFFEEASEPGGEEARVAEIMTREVGRLDKVVGDLLDFAKPDALHRAPVRLDALVERVRRLLDSDLHSRNVMFDVQVEGDIPEISADGDRLTQVLLNLCLNGMQAMEGREEGRGDEQAALVVRVREDGEHAVLEVEDHGCGMDAETLKHVFSPYFTSKAHGNGLGLSIVHKLVEAHGGRLEVLSTPGKGSVFRVLLPLLI